MKAPTSARTIEWQKASARTENSTGELAPALRPTRRQPMSWMVRTLEAPGRARQNAAKSCSPTKGAAAASIASTSSARGCQSTWPRVRGS